MYVTESIVKWYKCMKSWKFHQSNGNYHLKKEILETYSIRKFFGYSVQFSSAAQLCPTLCNHMNRSTPGLPVHHQLPEFTQTHVHRVNGHNFIKKRKESVYLKTVKINYSN